MLRAASAVGCSVPLRQRGQPRQYPTAIGARFISEPPEYSYHFSRLFSRYRQTMHFEKRGEIKKFSKLFDINPPNIINAKVCLKGSDLEQG